MQCPRCLRAPGARGAMAAAVLAMLATFVVWSPQAALASPTITGVSNAYADGGSVTVAAGALGAVNVGPLFPASLGCTAQPGSANSSGATLNLNSAGGGGPVTDQVMVQGYTSSVTVTSSATVANVSLLSGKITASAINATAQSVATATTLASHNLSTLTNVRVNGQSVTVKPNQKITLPGVGYVVLDEQSTSNSASNTRLFVNAIDVHITTATLGLPVGSQIIVAHALSQFSRTPVNAVVGASSYGLYAQGAGGSQSGTSGPYAWEVISCVGGQGTTTLASASLVGVLSLNAMNDFATGQIALSGITSQASSTVHNATLGMTGTTLLSAGSIQATANASFVGASGRTSGSVTLTNGSILSGLLPSALPTNPAPNTRMNIPLLGYVILNQQTGYVRATKVIIAVTAIVIVATVPNNLLGLPVGAHISIGVATAYAIDPSA